jgi:IS605 OrfB family transposase
MGTVLPQRVRETLILENNSLRNTRMANLRLELKSKLKARSELAYRISKPTRDYCQHESVPEKKRATAKYCRKCAKGYYSKTERYMKKQRLGKLDARIIVLRKQLAEGNPSTVLGGRRLANTRHHLEEAGLTLGDWQDKRLTARGWYGCSGSTNLLGGNQVFKIDLLGTLSIELPMQIAREHGLPVKRSDSKGGILTLVSKVRFPYGGDELHARIQMREAVRFDLDPVYKHGRLHKIYLRASWTREDPPVPTLETARACGMVGVDLNSGHLDAWRIDQSGNPVGRDRNIPMFTSGLSAGKRSANIRQAIKELLDYVIETNAGTLVIENLNFEDETSREKHGHNKKFRNLIAGFPTAQFAGLVVRMGARRGVTVVAVNPKYTSKHGGKAWARQLTDDFKRNGKKNTPRLVTVHAGAAVAIARRGAGLGLVPKGGKPKPQQRRKEPAVGQEPVGGYGSMSTLTGLDSITPSPAFSTEKHGKVELSKGAALTATMRVEDPALGETCDTGTVVKVNGRNLKSTPAGRPKRRLKRDKPDDGCRTEV